MYDYFGFVYITTNLINGKKYIGKCQFTSESRNKNYLGSGVNFRQAVAEFGKENFSREIVYFAKTKEELNLVEIEFIKLHNAVLSPNYYNKTYRCCGGQVGEYNEERNKKISESRKKQNICWNRGKTNIYSDETIEKIRNSAIKHYVKIFFPDGTIDYAKGCTETCEKTKLTYNLFYKLIKSNQPYVIKPGKGISNKLKEELKPLQGIRLEKISMEQYLEETSTTIP